MVALCDHKWLLYVIIKMQYLLPVPKQPNFDVDAMAFVEQRSVPQIFIDFAALTIKVHKTAQSIDLQPTLIIQQRIPL